MHPMVSPDDYLLGWDLDDALVGYAPEIEPAVPEIDWSAVPALTKRERAEAMSVFERDLREHQIALGRDRKRGRSPFGPVPVASTLPSVPSSPSVRFEPERGWDGPTIVFTQNGSEWGGFCSRCGPVQSAPDPYDGAFGHLRASHPVRRSNAPP